MAKSNFAVLKTVMSLALTQLGESVVNGHRVAKRDLVVAPIWRFSKESEGVHLFTHGNREYWVISEKDVEVKTKGKGFFSSKDIEVKVRNFYLVPMSKDHKGRPCYLSYLTNLDTLVKQGILKECWSDITKTEMSEILGHAVKLLADAQDVPVSKFKALAKTLKIRTLDTTAKKGKSGKKTEKSTEGLLQQVLDGFKEMQVQMASREAKAEAPVQEPAAAPVAETPVQKPAPTPRQATNKNSTKQSNASKQGSKASAPASTKPTAESAASQLSEQLAAMDLLGNADPFNLDGTTEQKK